MNFSHHSGLRRVVARTRPPGERGFALVTFALLLIPLLLMSGLAVDVGYWYNRASNLQKAADAASLAGVVWLPDETKADQFARDAASRNGFTDGVDDVTVVVQKVAERRLRVTITDDKVGSFFYESLTGKEIDIGRSGTAEYVLPVPLGSPRNFFGTGTLNTGYSENLWLSINTWCTDKVDGDRYQSQYFGNRPYSSTNCPSPVPSGSPIQNEEYRDTGYELYVDVPTGRTQSIDLLLYDPRLQTGSGSPDLNLYSGAQDYTFTLFRADNTPLTDTDNVPIASCTRTYTGSTAFESTYNSYLGGSRWNRLCRIGTGATWPDGRYILRMTNTPGQRYGAAANNFSVVARYATYTGNGLCDARTVATCPRVYGKDAISVFASESSSVASFFLAEIDAEHVGKTLELELWDPGEGGQKIEFLQPTGANSWAKHNFSWESFEDDGTPVASGTNVNEVDVTGSRFNGRLLRIQIPLDGYIPPVTNEWWKIQYTFGSGTVTDRTTWSAKVIGDPVHLVEEEAP